MKKPTHDQTHKIDEGYEDDFLGERLEGRASRAKAIPNDRLMNHPSTHGVDWCLCFARAPNNSLPRYNSVIRCLGGKVFIRIRIPFAFYYMWLASRVPFTTVPPVGDHLLV